MRRLGISVKQGDNGRRRSFPSKQPLSSFMARDSQMKGISNLREQQRIVGKLENMKNLPKLFIKF